MVPSNQQLSDSGGHSKFVELCALYSTGSLSRLELDELDRHLSICNTCRTLLADYSQLVCHGIPLLAGEEDIPPATGYDRELAAARKNLLANLDKPARQVLSNVTANSNWTKGPFGLQHLIALAFSLLLGLAGYMIGTRHGLNAGRTQLAGDHESAKEMQLRDQLARAISSRDDLDAAVKGRDEKLLSLSAELSRQAASISKLKEMANEAGAEKSRQGTALADVKDENAALKSDRDRIGRQLHDLEGNLAQLNRQIETLQAERIAGIRQNTDMQRRIDELTVQTRLSQSTISQQERLLASDRDVRELMGARDLLISDVFDVDQDGHNLPAFGRVFYTRNKSLIFYAFDLDKEPGARNASTFQAWGTRTTAQGGKRPVNMGILYIDNAENRRWALKFDNPKVLEQIDAVFVTVEPHGGSEKPRGKERLYAYLRSQPNHP